MPHNRVAMLAAGVALGVALVTLTVRSQGLITHRELSSDMAQAIVQGSLDKCRADGSQVSVSVVDSSGLLKAFARDDGASPHTITNSLNKAYTALTYKRTSGEMQKTWAANPPAPNVPGTVAAAGGVPIKAGTEFIGAVGVSGSSGGAGTPGGTKDELCANAGIAKVADNLK